MNAPSTSEDPAYLQITYHYVDYLKYTELKSFSGHWFECPNQYTNFLIPLDTSMIVKNSKNNKFTHTFMSLFETNAD